MCTEVLPELWNFDPHHMCFGSLADQAVSEDSRSRAKRLPYSLSFCIPTISSWSFEVFFPAMRHNCFPSQRDR